MDRDHRRRARDNYAVTISGGEASELIQFQVSRRIAHWGLAALILLCLGGIAGLFMFGGVLHRAKEADRLESDNLLLSRQLTRMAELEARVVQLDRTRQELLKLVGIENPESDPTLTHAASDVGPAGGAAYHPVEPGDEITAENIEDLSRLITQIPLTGPVTRFYGPVGARGVFHAGIDVAGETGSDIVAAGSGIVVQLAQDEVFGNVLVIAHDPGIETMYGHNSNILCDIGDFVNAGQKVAEVGSTGQSSAPHLHFEVHWQRRAIDPALFFSAWQVTGEEGE